MKNGIVHLYIGDGKGKTIAAVGLTIRAAGNDLKVGFFQFFKTSLSGEIKILKKIDNIKFYSYLPKHPYFQKFVKTDIENYKKETKKTLKEILKIVKKEKFDIVILDEILIALRDRFLKEDDIIDFLEKKPRGVEFVLTGRCKVSNKLKKTVQIITEMKNIKHPYPKIPARKGIEF